MDRNEIKKILYKEKPLAICTPRNGVIYRKGIIFYEARLQDGTIVQFDIDVKDLGDADLHPKMSAQLLIRYLI